MTTQLRACGAPFSVLAAATALAVCLGGCTTIDETALNVFASHTPVAGLFAGRVMQGNASFTHARTGTMHLQSADAPALSCFGALQLTATLGGVVNLSCSDGRSVAIPFQVLGPLRGTGRVEVGDSLFALTYGLPADMAAAYLGVPAGRLTPAP